MRAVAGVPAAASMSAKAAREPPSELGGPSIALDQPLAERRLLVHNELVLSGWAISPARIEDVVVDVAGTVFGAARGLPSPDLAALLPGLEGSAHGRFELRVPTSGLPRGEAHVEVRVVDAEGCGAALSGLVVLTPFEPPAWSEEDRRASLAGGRTEMWCEQPALDGSARPRGPLSVSGWALCEAGIEAVFVDVDDRTRIEATTGLLHPHLRGQLGERWALRAGFSATIDPRELGVGSHRLTVVAVGLDGRAVGMSGVVVRPEPLDGSGEPLGLEDVPPVPPPSLGDGSRFVPEEHAGTATEVEHHLRYRWVADLAAGRRTLDAACGCGFGTAVLAEAGAARVVGLDSEDVAVEAARQRLGARAEIVAGRLERMPFDDGAFDLVVCFETIEHVEEQEDAFDELRRVLANDGVLAISSPNRGVYPAGNPHHVAELTSTELERAVRRRFRNVAMFRQQTQVASSLRSDVEAGVAEPAARIDASVRTLADCAPGSELYTVALASDGPVPRMGSRVMLGNGVDVQYLTQVARMWEQRAILAEADAAAWRTDRWSAEAIGAEVSRTLSACEGKLRAAHAERRQLEARLLAVHASRSWRVTRPLRAVMALVRRAEPDDA